MTNTFRRKVLYIPGFDPLPPRRYRELYRTESASQAAISGYRIALSPAPKQRWFGWQARGEFPDGTGEAQFEVLLWTDLVQNSMRKGIIGTYRQLFATAWVYIGSGALSRLMKLRRGPVLAALYPIFMLLLQAITALLAGWLAGWATATVLNWWAGAVVMIAVFCAGLYGFRRLDHRLFAYYLMHDYAFTAQHKGAYPDLLEQRLAVFTDRLAEVLQGDYNEVLVVGHSSGAYLGVSVIADLIRSGRLPQDGPNLALLTLGHVVPMASFLPHAQRLRADLAHLSEQSRIFWLDVTAPGDACCFGLCDPVAVTGVAGPAQRWPLVISAAFTQTLSPEKQKAMRWRWFRRHFQYLCAFDRPADYDYFAITCGVQSLAQRFAGRTHSPGRLAIAAGPGLLP